MSVENEKQLHFLDKHSGQKRLTILTRCLQAIFATLGYTETHFHWSWWSSIAAIQLLMCGTAGRHCCAFTLCDLSLSEYLLLHRLSSNVVVIVIRTLVSSFYPYLDLGLRHRLLPAHGGLTSSTERDFLMASRPPPSPPCVCFSSPSWLVVTLSQVHSTVAQTSTSVAVLVSWGELKVAIGTHSLHQAPAN